jgi:hypothetical protein
VKLSPNEWAWLFKNVQIPDARAMTADEVVTATAIVFAESGGDTDVIAYSPTTSKSYGNADHGGVQISNWWHGARLQHYRFRDPYDSVRLFKLVWKDAGYSFGPWNVTDSGAEQQYMVRAEVGARHPFEPVNSAVVGWRR